VKATLGFLEKLTLSPDGVSGEDAIEVRAAGVSDAAIEQAVFVCAIFNIIDRVADAVGFEVPAVDGAPRYAPG
jgi:alkylhydroperoxidase family enzyme